MFYCQDLAVLLRKASDRINGETTPLAEDADKSAIVETLLLHIVYQVRIGGDTYQVNCGKIVASVLPNPNLTGRRRCQCGKPAFYLAALHF